MYHNARPYYVRLINGRVESYGRTGDFNSTKDPTVQVKTEAVNATPIDNYDRLIKLNELRKSGAITDAEYDREKAKLIKP